MLVDDTAAAVVAGVGVFVSLRQNCAKKAVLPHKGLVTRKCT